MKSQGSTSLDKDSKNSTMKEHKSGTFKKTSKKKSRTVRFEDGARHQRQGSELDQYCKVVSVYFYSTKQKEITRFDGSRRKKEYGT